MMVIIISRVLLSTKSITKTWWEDGEGTVLLDCGFPF